MKKKILGILTLVVSLFLLVACSSESMDGTYYRYRENSEVKSIFLDKSDVVTISGKVVSSDGKEGKIDYEKEVISYNSLEANYDYKEGILKVNDRVYIKEGTDKYKEVLKELENKSEE